MSYVILICGSFVVRLLAHYSDALVRCFHSHGFDLPYGDTVNSRLVVGALVPSCFVLDSLLLLLECVETCLLSLIKVGLVALVLSFGNVITRNVNSSVGETELVCDPLNFLLLHFLCDSGTKVLWAVFGLFF